MAVFGFLTRKLSFPHTLSSVIKATASELRTLAVSLRLCSGQGGRILPLLVLCSHTQRDTSMSEPLRRELLRTYRHLRQVRHRGASHAHTALRAISRLFKTLYVPDEPAEMRFRRMGRPFPIVDDYPTLMPVSRRTSLVKAVD